MKTLQALTLFSIIATMGFFLMTSMAFILGGI